ncbi:MAG: 3-dehydrosphinganine reductase [Caeruleum heppii]|nr:MAG: 3-dehydrosphinganine reductase [Caeruleum heppii]
MGFLRRKSQFPVDGRTVIVTGGSEGMGRAVAKLLAQKGANIILVARNVEKLRAAVEYISSASARPDQRFHYISADLTSPTEATRVLSESTAWNDARAPDIIFCCAGGSQPNLFVELSTDQLRAQMDQNYWSSAYIAHAALRAWLTPSPHPSKPSSLSSSATSPLPRHIIFTSSVVAFYPLVGYSPYAPAKAALRSLSDTLSQELQLYNGSRLHPSSSPQKTGSDVKIHTIFPGTIYSPGYAREALSKPLITRKLEEDDKGQTEEEAARASIRGLERGDYLVMTSFLGRMLGAAAWGGSPRNGGWDLGGMMTRVFDIVLTCGLSVGWLFVQPSLDGKVRDWGRREGHPTSYKKGTEGGEKS